MDPAAQANRRLMASVCKEQPAAPRATPGGDAPSKVTGVGADETRVADVAVVEGCRQGDPHAFEAFYRRHAGRIYGLVCRMIGNPADGEDLLQDIFLQAYRKLEAFKGDATLATWLYRLAVNRCLDYLRSKTGRLIRLTDPLDPDDEPAAAPGWGGGAGLAVTRIDLERAIAQLPPGYRAAFLLHDVEGFEHHEVASILGVADGTSKSQVHKARLRLRAILCAEGRDGRTA